MTGGPPRIGVGGIDQRDPDLDGPAQHSDRLVVVARLSPDPLARDPHRADPARPTRHAAFAREASKVVATRDWMAC